VTELRDPSIEVTQRIEAPPEIVFAYLTDSARFTAWMGIDARLDPRPGGSYQIRVDDQHVASGQYREIEPPRRLLMTWGWEGHPTVPPGSTLVEITLRDEAGGTLLRLRHTGLPGKAEQRLHADGWGRYLDQLARVSALRKATGAERPQTPS
jgi:uncharacterized protein YndB with AHSA1/START domain